MGALEGRVAIVTGAGAGIGREHALLFAREGARVVVNDLGTSASGDGSSPDSAHAVVDEIRAMGGEAVASTDDITDWKGSKRLIDTALDAFGDLHCLVNNAGVVSGWQLLDLSERDWDVVMQVHLKGAFCVMRHAAAYWREKAEAAGVAVNASIVSTASGAGLLNEGPSNYAAAKAGVAAFAQTIAKELMQYGVRVNSIAPVARTRLTEDSGGSVLVRRPDKPDSFDRGNPANISPLVAYLSTSDCPYTGGVWHVYGGQIGLCEGWKMVESRSRKGQWTVDDLRAEVPTIVKDRLEQSGRLISDGQSTLEFLSGRPA